MINLIDDYISIVVVINHSNMLLIDYLKKLVSDFSAQFTNFELLVVDNCNNQKFTNIIKESIKGITLIELSRAHSTQEALTAGVDLAIGDFVYEIENLDAIDFNELMDIYSECKNGNDFVFLLHKITGYKSKIFYKILGFIIKDKKYSKFTSTVATIASRRGLNKIADIGNRIIHRKVAYSLSGLNIGFKYSNSQHFYKRGLGGDLSLMIDTFIYYTNVMYKISAWISIFFLSATSAFIFYSVYSFLTKSTVEGWASLSLISSFGFFGIFLMITITIKYLDQIIYISTNHKSYIYRDVIKL